MCAIVYVMISEPARLLVLRFTVALPNVGLRLFQRAWGFFFSSSQATNNQIIYPFLCEQSAKGRILKISGKKGMRSYLLFIL